MAELTRYDLDDPHTLMEPCDNGDYYRADEVDERMEELTASLAELEARNSELSNIAHRKTSEYREKCNAYVEQGWQLSRAHAALRDAPVMEDTDRIQCGCHFEQKGWRERHAQAIKEARES